MTEDINPLAPAEDATQDEPEPEADDAEEPEGDDEQPANDAEAAKEAEPEPAPIPEAPRAVDQRHPNPEHQAKLHEPTP